MVWLALALVAAFWVADSAIDSYITGEGSFVQHLLPDDPIERFLRPLVCLLLVAFGLYADRSIRRIHTLEAEKRELLLRKEQTLVKLIAGLLPICVECKDIRNEEGQWVPAESYVREVTGSQFTHGLCPQCSKRIVSGLAG